MVAMSDNVVEPIAFSERDDCFLVASWKTPNGVSPPESVGLSIRATLSGRKQNRIEKARKIINCGYWNENDSNLLSLKWVRCPL